MPKKHTFFSTLKDKQNMGLSGDPRVNIDFMPSAELKCLNWISS